MRRRRRYQQGGAPVNTTGYLKGYKTNQNPVNIIPSGHITTQNMTGPILANGHLLMPDTGDYMFPTSHVIEHKLGKGGHTTSTPQYLSTYPNDNNTTPMPKSLRGKKAMQKGGRHFDPQLGNYMSNIYAVGGLTYPPYPYTGYNDAERGMFSGMMQQGGMYPNIYQGAPPPPPYFLAHAQMGGPMPQPGPSGAMPQPSLMPPGMPPMQPPQQQAPPPRHGGKGFRPKGGKRGKMQQGGGITAQNIAKSQASGYEDASAADYVNSLLAGTSRNVNWGNPVQNQLSMQAYMWHQQNHGRSPEQTIQSFYDRPVSPGNAVDSVRQRYSNFGQGPVANYHTTPNISVAGPAGAVASSYQIGGSTSVPPYRTTKITGRVKADQSDGEMSDDWMDVFYGNPDMKKGGWISKAVNPAHKGYCTPMSKPTCTGHRRALALLFKRKHGFHKKQEGGEYLQGMEMQQGGLQGDPNPINFRPEYNLSPSEYPSNYRPAGPTYNMLPSQGGYLATPSKADSASYLSHYNLMRNNPQQATEDYQALWHMPHMSNQWATATLENRLSAYEDGMQPGTMSITLPPDTKKPKNKRGGKFRGRMQQGGYPTNASFTPAGSLIDQNTWAMNSEGSPIVPPTGNYYKTDPSQTSLTGALPGQPATVPLSNARRPYTIQQNVNNHEALQALLPINAGLSSLAQHNDWNQRQTSYIKASTNPLSTMGYDNGKTQESRYGYNNYQGGGETMPFAGVPLHLWRMGGGTPGAARSLRPYMLHQGRFQQGGDLMDEWDMEDGQDAIEAQRQQSMQGNPYAADEGYDSEIQRRSDPDDDQDYQSALQIAMGGSFLNNPYFQ